jgi:hypothetical protein
MGYECSDADVVVRIPPLPLQHAEAAAEGIADGRHGEHGVEVRAAAGDEVLVHLVDGVQELRGVTPMFRSYGTG